MGKPLQDLLLPVLCLVFFLQNPAYSQDLLKSDQIEQMLENVQTVIPDQITGRTMPRTRGITAIGKTLKPQVKSNATSSNAVVFNNVLIRFDTNSAMPTRDSLPQVKEIAKALQSKKFNRNSFLLVGHTDRRGSAAFNRNLSERRANYVKQFIIDRSTVPSSRILTAGRGEDLPLDEADTASAWRKNRRVELFLLPMAEARIVYRRSGQITEHPLKSGQVLKSGDDLAFHFSAFDDSYFYIFTVDTRMKVSMIFPQGGSDETNFLKSGQSMRFPDDLGSWFSLDANTGSENIYMCATRKPADTAALLAEIRMSHPAGGAPATRGITGIAGTQQIVDDERRHQWQSKYDYVKHIEFKHE